jgi:hypothetical protein
MSMQSLVKAALKDKSQTLYRQLAKSGELDGFVTTRAEEISDAVGTLTMEIAAKNGANKTTDYMEKVGILNMAQSQAREIVLAEMLEFPTDD